jgi:hypothetical protein
LCCGFSTHTHTCVKQQYCGSIGPQGGKGIRFKWKFQ